MKWIRGYYRLSLASLTISLGGTLIVLTSWIPYEIKGLRPSFWLLLLTVRTMLFALNVKVNCPDREKLRQHRGYIFPNHISYLDVLVLVGVTPVRFLAKDEVRAWPVIGIIAKAIGCVFVRREDKESRAEARASLAKVDTHPPIALFPEGKRGPGDELLPFRYGAFEIVIQGQAPFFPCVVVYDQQEIAIWHRGEHVIKALWRLGTNPRPIQAQLICLDAVHPTLDDDPIKLSIETRDAMTALIKTLHPQQITEKPK